MFTQFNCSKNNAVAFLGGLQCEIPKMVGVALWKAGTTFPADFGKTELDELIQEGGFIGSVMGDGIENNNTDPTYSESIMKVRRETDGGRKGFTVTFDFPHSNGSQSYNIRIGTKISNTYGSCKISSG